MLTAEQLEGLTQLHAVAEQFAAEVAIIGAAALLYFIDLRRFTRDVDLVVALDREDFATFPARLRTHGWSQEFGTEHRWRGPKATLVDLIPAGPKLRASKQLVWPESQFTMSLAGLDHAFARSVLFLFAPDVRFRVAPPPVIALLKIVAYTEDPNRRRKDLDDLASLLCRYEAESDRIFGDDVLAAELDDIEYANAFLLGLDVGAIVTGDDAEIVSGFLGKQLMSVGERQELVRDDSQEREVLRFQLQLKAFEKGFDLIRRK